MRKRFHDHFSAAASRYADYRPRYPAALFDFLATLASPDCLVWDCAAGNGQATADLAARFSHIIATDASADQIASATLQSNIEYRVALAEESGLASESAGLITVAQALHWFNLEQFYAEAKRVLIPGGALAVWTYGINQVESHPINDLVQDFYGNVVGPYWPPERALVEDGYRSLPFPFSEMTVPAFDMRTRWTLDLLLGYLSTWSATNRYRKETARDPIEPLAKRLSLVWGDPDSPRLVTWPLSVRIGRKADGH